LKDGLLRLLYCISVDDYHFDFQNFVDDVHYDDGDDDIFDLKQKNQKENEKRDVKNDVVWNDENVLIDAKKNDACDNQK